MLCDKHTLHLGLAGTGARPVSGHPSRETQLSEVMYMPCECATATPVGAPIAGPGFGRETASGAGCGCSSGPEPSDRAISFERSVMELDKRLRRLEGGIRGGAGQAPE